MKGIIKKILNCLKFLNTQKAHRPHTYYYFVQRDENTPNRSYVEVIDGPFNSLNHCEKVIRRKYRRYNPQFLYSNQFIALSHSPKDEHPLPIAYVDYKYGKLYKIDYKNVW